MQAYSLLYYHPNEYRIRSLCRRQEKIEKKKNRRKFAWKVRRCVWEGEGKMRDVVRQSSCRTHRTWPERFTEAKTPHAAGDMLPD